MALVYEADAVREQVYLRALLMGPTGSGKSRGALELAKRIFDATLKTTLVNTEKGRGKMYADRYPFDYIDLAEDGDFSPETYIEAIDLAEQRNRGGVLLIDSVSHEWMGAGGILQQADRFGEWKTVRPKHNGFVERLMAVDMHVVVTCRAKMKYEVGEEEVQGRKKQVIRMLGVGPIQSDDLQYEFNLVGRFDQETHDVAWSGHIDPLIDTVSNFANEPQTVAVAEAVTKWLAEGVAMPEPPEAAPDEAVDELVLSLRDEGLTEERIQQGLARGRQANRGVLTPEYVAAKLAESKDRIAKKAKESAGETAPAAAAAEEPAK